MNNTIPLTWTDIQTYIRSLSDDDIVHIKGERYNSILSRAYYLKAGIPCSMLLTHKAGIVSIEVENYTLPPMLWRIHELCEAMPVKAISKREYIAYMSVNW